MADLQRVRTLRVRDLGPLGGCARGAVGPTGSGVVGPTLVAPLGWGECVKDLVPPESGAAAGAVVAADCMDGRPLAAGCPDPGAPRTAGGTLSVVFGLWALDQGGTPAALASRLMVRGLPVWVHHGCGANAGLEEMMGVLAGPTVDDLRSVLGCGAPAAPRRTWVGRLAAHASGTDAAGRLAGMAEAGITPGAFDGTHHEVAAVINRVPGTTLDRGAMAAALGVQAFVVDAWALAGTAAAVLAGLDANPAWRLPLADILLDISLAAVCVLGGPSLHLVALDAT